MPDQFFYVHLDDRFAEGYDAMQSGLLHNYLVIHKASNTIRTVKQPKAQACSGNCVYKNMDSVHELSTAWNITKRYVQTVFDSLVHKKPVGLMCDNHYNYQFAVFQPTNTTSDRHIHVYPRNLCREAVDALQLLLNDEVHYVDEDLSIFAPVVISGYSVEEALLSVSDTYDVTDYISVDQPCDRDGAPWMEDFRYNYYCVQKWHSNVTGLKMTFSHSEIQKFEQRYSTDNYVVVDQPWVINKPQFQMLQQLARYRLWLTIGNDDDSEENTQALTLLQQHYEAACRYMSTSDIYTKHMAHLHYALVWEIVNFYQETVDDTVSAYDMTLEFETKSLEELVRLCMYLPPSRIRAGRWVADFCTSMH